MFDFLSVLLPKRCVFCRKPHPDGLCGDCRDRLPMREPPYQGGVIAPLYYRDNVRFALHRYKFRGVSGYAEVFAELMAKAAGGCGIEADVVTWVPCSFFRRWTRGYDQSEKLARAAAKRLSLPAKRLLIKKRHARSQTKMSNDEMRVRNIRDAFKASAALDGKRVLLIDDIRTSGATMEECRKVLTEAGAAQVICCAAASR